MDMKTFYGKCGDFIRHRIVVLDIAPNRQEFHVVFYYTRGEATYTGSTWKFSLTN